MLFPMGFWILLVVAAVLDAVGFKKFVWFLSVGYGLSIAGIGAALAVMGLVKGEFCIAYLLQCILMLVYGCRLGLFLLIRELKNANYRKTLNEQAGGDKKMPLPVLIFIWLIVVLLYYMQASPVFYRLSNGYAGKADAAQWIGLIISAIGVLLETVADKQKSAQKKENPKMAATKGLYRYCRCPNYFGEILMWIGVFVSGVTIFKGWQWAFATIGLISIIYIMFDGAKRLEIRQNNNYGHIPEYQAYAAKTPIIIPFLPIYHLTK